MKGEFIMEKVIREGRMSVVTLLVRLFVDFIAFMIFVGFIWIIKYLVAFLLQKFLLLTENFLVILA